MWPIALAVVLLIGCAPDIAAGTYLCGREQLCPEGQVCNGTDHTCVLAGQQQPFSCGATTELEPNNAQASAQVMPPMPCASALTEVLGCAPVPTDQDWFRIDVPQACSTVRVEARIISPVAFAPMSLVLHDAGGAAIGAAMPCGAGTDHEISDELCLEQAVVVGGRYALEVRQAGAYNCDGGCAHNRYVLTFALESP